MTQLQLQRNSEVFYSSVDLQSTASTAMTPSNTWKLDILSGFAVSADSITRQITHSQHGNTIDRSVASYTIGRNPVDWNFTVYLRATGAEQPTVAGGTSPYSSASGNAKPTADWFLWQALISNTAPAGTGEQSTWYGQGKISTSSYAASLGSHASRSSSASRPEGFLYFKLDNIIYAVSNATVNSASLNAGISEIVTVEWNGKGSKLTELTGGPRDRAVTVFGGTLNSGATAVANSNVTTLSRQSSYHPYGRMNVSGAVSTAPYIKNRLSVVELGYNSNTYTFPVTAFSFEYNNAIKHIEREQLGLINNVATGYSVERNISGSISMYLRSGDNASAKFLREISTIETQDIGVSANTRIYIGGRTGPYFLAEMPATSFSYPSIAVEDVLGLSANFIAHETAPRAANELTIKAIRFAESTSAYALGIWVDSGFWDDAAVWSG